MDNKLYFKMVFFVNVGCLLNKTSRKSGVMNLDKERVNMMAHAARRSME